MYNAIIIEGPNGSGKATLARRLSERIKYNQILVGRYASRNNGILKTIAAMATLIEQKTILTRGPLSLHVEKFSVDRTYLYDWPRWRAIWLNATETKAYEIDYRPLTILVAPEPDLLLSMHKTKLGSAMPAHNEKHIRTEHGLARSMLHVFDLERSGFRYVYDPPKTNAADFVDSIVGLVEC